MSANHDIKESPVHTDPGQVVAGFVAAFASKDTARLAPFLHPDVEFESYGDAPVVGRDAVLAVWAGVFRGMAQVEFTTLHQAVSGDLVLAEQVHGLATRRYRPSRRYEISTSRMASR